MDKPPSIHRERKNRPLQRYKVSPTQTELAAQSQHKKGFLRTVKLMLGMVVDTGADDIERLKEAYIRNLEQECEIKAAEKDKLHAEAEKLRAETDRIKRMIEGEAFKKKVEGLKALAEAGKNVLDSEIHLLQTIKPYLNDVRSAIATIEKKHGRIGVCSQQLLTLVESGVKEFSDDQMLSNAGKKSPHYQSIPNPVLGTSNSNEKMRKIKELLAELHFPTEMLSTKK